MHFRVTSKQYQGRFHKKKKRLPPLPNNLEVASWCMNHGGTELNCLLKMCEKFLWIVFCCKAWYILYHVHIVIVSELFIFYFFIHLPLTTKPTQSINSSIIYVLITYHNQHNNATKSLNFEIQFWYHLSYIFRCVSVLVIIKICNYGLF